ncbi:MAG: DUF5058 family protein [Christensenellaceae bacterium]|jgi:apolipoprotein N-acyltransferase|nr:DUF5058 family protein [Christensenellaceae bacterium]
MENAFVWVYILGGVIISMIIIMSTYFLIKALKRAKEIGMSSSTIKNTIKSSIVFSIAPSIPIVIGVGILMNFLGLAISWIRLSVVGALQYEILAMDQIEIINQESHAAEFIGTAAVIMTISILSGLIFNIFAYKKFQKKIVLLEQNNKKLLDTITGSLLGGIVAGLASHTIIGAFFTQAKPVSEGGKVEEANGYITLLTMVVAMVVMAICGILIKKLKWSKLENYALPITILIAMGCAYGLTFLF